MNDSHNRVFFCHQSFSFMTIMLLLVILLFIPTDLCVLFINCNELGLWVS